MKFIEIIAIRHKDSNYKCPFVVVLDWAPVHIGIEFRKAFDNKYGKLEKGILVYVPPQLTSQLQVLDTAVFAAFKSSYNISHTKIITTGIHQHTARSEFLWTSKNCRSAAYRAVNDAWSGLKVSRNVKEAFESLFVDTRAVRENSATSAKDHKLIREVRGQRRPKKDESFIMFALVSCQ